MEVKDVRLPVQMQRAMATEAEATREARAKVVAAEGEQKASIALREAADTINKSPIALQLRYLQTLTHIAAEKNSTIVFPIPLEFVQLFVFHFLLFCRVYSNLLIFFVAFFKDSQIVYAMIEWTKDRSRPEIA